MKKVFLAIVIILILTIMPSALYAQCEKKPGIQERLSKYLESQTKFNNFHGSVLIEKKGKILLSEGFDMADYENKVKNTAKTTFPIGSATKSFIALSIMQLVENNKISVNDTVSKFITDYPNGNQITIKQLLTHTSKVKSFLDEAQESPELDDKILKLTPENRTPENIIKIIGQEGLASRPPNTFSYNNSGYLILGRIVEKVSGLDLKDYLNKNIFKPLGMKNTKPSYVDGKKMYSSQGYLGYLENTLDENDVILLNYAFGSGYLSSNVIDMNKWLNALDSGKLVSKKTIDEIFSPKEYTKNAMTLKSVYDYGYGWFISQDGKKVMHGGNTCGFTSSVSKYLEQDINIVILSNKVGSGLDILDIEDNLYKICLGETVELPKPKIEFTLSNEQLKKYIGTYYCEKLNATFDIKLIDGHLKVTNDILNLNTLLIPESEEKFYFKSVIYEITFKKDSNDNITGLNLSAINNFDFIKKQ